MHLVRISKLRGLVTAFALILATGCHRPELPSPNVGPWQEEVRLSDGNVVVVERIQTRQIRRAIGGPADEFTQSSSIRFIRGAAHPPFPPIEMPFRPLLLDFDARKNAWIIVGFNDYSCVSMDPKVHYGYLQPNGVNTHPTFEYQLVDRRWILLTGHPDRIGQASNLMVPLTPAETAATKGRTISLDDKNRMRSPYGDVKFYETIVSSRRC